MGVICSRACATQTDQNPTDSRLDRSKISAFNSQVCFQVGCQPGCIGCCTLHANGHSLHAPQRKPAVKRRQPSTLSILHKKKSNISVRQHRHEWADGSAGVSSTPQHKQQGPYSEEGGEDNRERLSKKAATERYYGSSCTKETSEKQKL